MTKHVAQEYESIECIAKWRHHSDEIKMIKISDIRVLSYLHLPWNAPRETETQRERHTQREHVYRHALRRKISGSDKKRANPSSI